ncbi:MAG: hypothetical protein ACREQY_07440, partial [Candidatus Binatia bacterium]
KRRVMRSRERRGTAAGEGRASRLPGPRAKHRQRIGEPDSDDGVARRYGFAGGLVPGIVVYAHLIRPLVDAFGLEWLERGGAAARFVKPCYDGEEIVVRAKRHGPSALGLVVERAGGEVCAAGTAALRAAPEVLPEPGECAERALPKERPAASADSLRPGTSLGTVISRPDPRRDGFADAIGDDSPAYRGGEAAVHPGFLLGLANEALARNVVLGPWIHAASEVTNLSVARSGDTLRARSRIVDRFDRKVHELVVLDVLVLAEPDRPVQRIRHTAIYRPRPAERT